MKLYEITEQYLKFQDLCEIGVIPEEAAKDTLESINGEFSEKVDNIACLIKNSVAQSKALREEAGNLYKRAAAKDKASEYLTNYLLNNMKIAGKICVETNRNKITIRKNPESVEFDNDFISWAQINADHFLKYKEPTPDKKALKEAMKSGQNVPRARLIQNERVEIK